jgi:hypothetical protein
MANMVNISLVRSPATDENRAISSALRPLPWRYAAAVDAAFVDSQQERDTENRFEEKYDWQKDRHRRQSRQSR